MKRLLSVSLIGINFRRFCRANEVVIVKRSDDEIGLTDEVLLDDSLKWCQKKKVRSELMELEVLVSTAGELRVEKIISSSSSLGNFLLN